MIYLDVTSACKSPMNTGVQRVVRSLHRSLPGLTPVTPVVWDPQLKTYCALSMRELGFLVAPFGRQNASNPSARHKPGDAEPGRRANPVPLVSKWSRAVVHRWNRLEFPGCLRAEDTLFVPEIFQDNRIALLRTWVRDSPARLVAVCHDAIAWRRPEITPSARQPGFLAYLETLASFHSVVAVSRETEEDLRAFWRERGCPEAPVVIEPWPVNHAGTERKLVQSRPNTRSVVCVGTFEPRKNHLRLLTAAEKLWQRGVEFELILIGRTTADWGGRILTAINGLHDQGRPIRWLRHINDHALHDAYDECAFTVFPSLAEGFGLPILESLWHGRPCVCGRNGAIGEIAQGGGCLTIDQSDTADLAAGMERLLTDPALLGHLREEARARVFDSWEALAARLLPLLDHASV